MLRLSTIYPWFVWISASVFFASCESKPEYNTTADGLQWKLVSFTDSGQKLDSAEQYYVELLITDNAKSDTLFYKYNQLLKKGSDPLRNFLQTRSVGDSLYLQTSLRDTLNADLPFRDTLIYRLRIDRMRTAAQLEDRRLNELTELDSLVRTDSVLSAYREMDGVYFKTIQRPDTAKVVKGKEIVIHYQGRTLEGETFDDSRRMSAPLRFIYGNEGQVLPGIDLALSQMHLDEKAEVIMPSWHAFGSEGSADGRVPPFTTVVYRIEVIELSKE
jgi:hypothetical protein